MTAKQLFALLGQVDDAHIAGAETYRYRPKISKKIWLSAAATAACLCLVVSLFASMGADNKALDAPGAVPPVPTPSTPSAPAVPAEPPAETPDTSLNGPPSVIIDGVTYMQSEHLTAITLTLPEGFAYAGQCEYGPYYQSPDHPLWVYVQETVRTDGRADDTGTVIPIEPQPGYVRYVVEWLRLVDLVRVEDRLYCRATSEYSYESFAFAQALSREEYTRLGDKYGFRIEADSVEGFALLGAADFTGHDTLPDGALAANVDNAMVYQNPDEPNIVLVENTWHSASGEHHGFDVYLKWEVPEQ